MNKVCIVGMGSSGIRLAEALHNADMEVNCFIDNNAHKWTDKWNGLECVPFFKAERFYKELFDTLMIPMNYSKESIEDLIAQLLDANIASEDIFCAGINAVNGEIETIWNYLQVKRLRYLELPASLHCNLNCKNCDHFSPLYKKQFYELEQLKSDIRRLKEIFNYIDKIRIMGGEPLLNPELTDIICEVRKVYKSSDIRIVTNGTLLKRMSDDLIKEIRDSKVTIDISFYPSMYDSIEDTVKWLKEREIAFNLSQMVKVFHKPLHRNYVKNMYSPYKPSQCYCTNMYNGKLSICPRVMYISALNKEFGTDFSSSGVFDLYNDKIDAEILQKEIELCNYCTLGTEYENEPWDMLRGQSKAEDWM